MSSVLTAISFILSTALFAIARRGVPRPAGEHGADDTSHAFLFFICFCFTGVDFALPRPPLDAFLPAMWIDHVLLRSPTPVFHTIARASTITRRDRRFRHVRWLFPRNAETDRSPGARDSLKSRARVDARTTRAMRVYPLECLVFQPRERRVEVCRHRVVGGVSKQDEDALIVAVGGRRSVDRRAHLPAVTLFFKMCPTDRNL